MTPPLPFGGTDVLAWRLDATRHAATWDSGEGAFLLGGRWNSPGTRIVYCSFDAATAILEVAVHKGFAALDTLPHTLTSLIVTDPVQIHIVQPADVPNPNWLTPGLPSAGQQAFGDALLRQHKLVAIPSVVSPNSWNLLLANPAASGHYALRAQERFALDTRLTPRP